MPKYDASISYGKITDYFSFDTWLELGNYIKPHLDEGYEVTIKKRDKHFAGKIK